MVVALPVQWIILRDKIVPVSAKGMDRKAVRIGQKQKKNFNVYHVVEKKTSVSVGHLMCITPIIPELVISHSLANI